MLPVKDQQTALEEFRSLPPVALREVVGLWKAGIPAGHPLDRVLENRGSFGKRFTSDMRAGALLFRSGDGGWLPSGSRFGLRCVFTKSAGCESPETCFLQRRLCARVRSPP
jgi:hypothetical protein